MRAKALIGRDRYVLSETLGACAETRRPVGGGAGMRVALAADGTRGDIHPLLSLGEHFQRLGHDVLMCAPPNFRNDTELRGL